MGGLGITITLKYYQEHDEQTWNIEKCEQL